MPVPASYNDLYEGTEFRDHIGWVWYEREIVVPDHFFTQRIVLRFGSATHAAKVYLNGQLVVEHTDGQEIVGDEAPELHRRVGAHVAEIGADFALFGGDFADDLVAGALRAGLSSERIARFATNGEAAAWLRAHGREGDAVLLKGSRKYRLEEIVGELRA